jgi:DivIVA domain-containing protein
MAITFSRPDPSSPSAVAAATFTSTRRGYEPAEVRDLLRMVAAELARLQERETFLERELRASSRTVVSPTAPLDEEMVTRLLGEEAARILYTAREGAAQIKTRAEEGAARLLREANEEAQRVREEADVEAARRRHDASVDAEAELQMAKQQGREMVNEARAYRERVLGELSKRRELARQQIEQLVHGRDRLVQAFDRARIAAVDVMSELTPLGEPSEYVNLAPTTGPVPIMVPASRPVVVEEVAVAEEVVVEDVVVEDVVVEDAVIEDAVIEDVVVQDSATVVDDAAELAPMVDDDHTADNTVVLMRDTHDDHESHTDHDDGATLAPVVSLFAGEIVQSAPEPEPAPAVAEAEPLTEAEVAPTKRSVDDLFAKLRAARTSEVASQVVVEEMTIGGEELSVFQASPEAPVVATEVEDSPFGRRDAALTPLIVAAARKLKRVLADEQNDVLHALRRNEPVRVIDSLLPWQADHAERYAAAMGEELMEAALAGAASLSDGSPEAHRIDIGRTDALSPAVESLANSVVEPLRQRLERAVASAAGDNGELANSVRGIYREWKTQRIDEHLDDVLRMAYGRGAFAALVPGTKVCWMVDPAGPACPDAEDNSLAGAVAAGEPFPTDHVCAPAHEGCRCVLVPSRR